MDARKERYAAKDLKKLFAGATKIVAARGKKEVVFDLKKEPPSASELEKVVLGPTGNLRAPAIRMGKTWLIGYGDLTYEGLFG